MSIKFRRDGAVFPTEVKDGKLRIFIGSQFREIPLKFLKDDFPYDVTAYQQCNIMCYLENDSKIIVMRYNGTVTIYTKDRVVIGFTKFNPKDLYTQTNHIPVGVCAYNSGRKVETLYYCTLYRFKDEHDEYALEDLGSLEPYIFKVSENPKYAMDVSAGDRTNPRHRLIDNMYYAGNDEGYPIIGSLVKATKVIPV